MQEEIKPCPFCGGKANAIEYSNGWCVGCGNNNCLVQPCTEEPEHLLKNAIDSWNRRSNV